MSANSEEIRSFFERLHAANPEAQNTGTFLDRIEALLKERDELLETLKMVDNSADHASDCTVVDASESDEGCDCHCVKVTAAIGKAARP